MPMIKKIAISLCLLAVIGLSIALLPTQPVQAGVSGAEGGVVIPASFNIGAGGRVVLYLFQSDDCILAGGTPPASKSVSGAASGSYPTVGDLGGVTVAQGYVTLDRIEIIPDAGFAVDSLVVNGSSQGAVESYDFSGTSNSFSVTFRTAATSSETSAPTAAATAAATAAPETTAATVTPTVAPTQAATAVSQAAATTARPTTATSAAATTAALSTTAANTSTTAIAPPADSNETATVQTTSGSGLLAGLPDETPPIQAVGSSDAGSNQSSWPWWLVLLLILLLILFLLLLFYILKKIRDRQMNKSTRP